MWMRGGTSKGGYFLADDLPADEAARDAFLLRVMGSPDKRQIDGMGGADPLTSKVAVVEALGARGRRRRLPLPAGLRRPADRDRRAELREHPRRHRPLRHRARAREGRRRRDRRPHLHGEHRARSQSRRVPTPGGRVTYEGDGADRRRPRHGGGDPDPLQGHRRLILRRAAADRPRRRRDRRDRGDADRQRHAVRRHARQPTSASPARKSRRRSKRTKRFASGSRRSG